MWNISSDKFIGCQATYDEADIVLFGAPFDSTTSYRPGTRFGSRAIRSESFGIETYSPYQDKDLSDIAVFDGGDLELPFGNPRPALQMIEETTRTIVQDGKIPVLLGGEHLVSLGSVKGVLATYPDLHILHFDAHADLREDYLGEKLSHACVMRRIWELVGDNKIYQFGIRSGDRVEFEFAKQHVQMTPFTLEGLEEALRQLKGKPVYFTLDLDVLDPSVFPGTGTPEAGGITFPQLLKAILAIGQLNLVGCDVNELSPVYDPSGISTATACKIVRELLLAINIK